MEKIYTPSSIEAERMLKQLAKWCKTLIDLGISHDCAAVVSRDFLRPRWVSCANDLEDIPPATGADTGTVIFNGGIALDAHVGRADDWHPRQTTGAPGYDKSEEDPV